MSSQQVAAWFLGPKAENAEWERKFVGHILEDYLHWRRNYFPSDALVITESMRRGALDYHDRLAQQVEEMLAGLRRHFPFYSPRYMAHMISDQTLPSVLGYFAGLLYNPNNVTPESSPVTLDWELEVGASILNMLGYPPPPPAGKVSKEEFGWAHICSGGTVANLEALWLARTVRYFPLAVRDVCVQHGIPLTLRPAGHDAQPVPIDSLSPKACLGARPSTAIHLYARFIDALQRQWDLARSEAIRVAHEMLRESRFSVAHHGVRAAYSVRPPVLLVSGARHYSVTKAADLLGIGRENILLVDVDARFRLDTNDLAAKLNYVIDDGRLPLAVIGIAGTTEEGAVDPIDKIDAVRTNLENTRGESFWLHVDAAWGGYLRALFTAPAGEPATTLDGIRKFVSRELEIELGLHKKQLTLSWGNCDVYAALAAFPLAESITIDPHKLGYIPYPCGIAAYRNDLVRQFLTEEIPYLSTAHFEDVDSRQHRRPESVGPYILEGSKPGAAVAACWMSHRMIPPDRSGYGEILRASLLAAREFYERLIHADTELPYRLVPIAAQPPDTSIVPFFVQPEPARGLAFTNALNQKLYENFTLAGRDSDRTYSYSQPFFLSRTTFEQSSYHSAAMADLFERAGIDPVEYRMHGLFVLRATLMSPYHVLAAESGHGKSLIEEFFECLHQKTLALLDVTGH